jgi:hypothetical protein
MIFTGKEQPMQFTPQQHQQAASLASLKSPTLGKAFRSLTKMPKFKPPAPLHASGTNFALPKLPKLTGKKGLGLKG